MKASAKNHMPLDMAYEYPYLPAAHNLSTITSEMRGHTSVPPPPNVNVSPSVLKNGKKMKLPKTKKQISEIVKGAPS